MKYHLLAIILGTLIGCTDRQIVKIGMAEISDPDSAYTIRVIHESPNQLVYYYFQESDRKRIVTISGITKTIKEISGSQYKDFVQKLFTIADSESPVSLSADKQHGYSVLIEVYWENKSHSIAITRDRYFKSYVKLVSLLDSLRDLHSAQQGDAPEPATNVNPAQSTPSSPAR